MIEVISSTDENGVIAQEMGSSGQDGKSEQSATALSGLQGTKRSIIESGDIERLDLDPARPGFCSLDIGMSSEKGRTVTAAALSEVGGGNGVADASCPVVSGTSNESATVVEMAETIGQDHQQRIRPKIGFLADLEIEGGAALARARLFLAQKPDPLGPLQKLGTSTTTDGDNGSPSENASMTGSASNATLESIPSPHAESHEEELNIEIVPVEEDGMLDGQNVAGDIGNKSVFGPTSNGTSHGILGSFDPATDPRVQIMSDSEESAEEDDAEDSENGHTKDLVEMEVGLGLFDVNGVVPDNMAGITEVILEQKEDKIIMPARSNSTKI